MSVVQPGVCRHCRCTEDNACMLPTGDPCCWTNRERTVCSNSPCIIAEQARVARAKAEAGEAERRMHRLHGDRFVGMGYGLIREELRKEQARKRRQKRPQKKRRAA